MYVGNKDIAKYINSCFFALKKYDKVKIISRGSHIKKSLDILAIMIRDYLDNVNYEISVKSEKFEERFITSLEINLTGTRREDK